MSDARDRAAARLAEELGFRVSIEWDGECIRDIQGGCLDEADDIHVAMWKALLDREVALEEADGLATAVSGEVVLLSPDVVAGALARYRAARGRKA
jgi:hypothetical protein